MITRCPRVPRISLTALAKRPQARACTRSAGGDSSNCKDSRYGNSAIFANLILACQARDEGSGNENCSALLAELQPG